MTFWGDRDGDGDGTDKRTDKQTDGHMDRQTFLGKYHFRFCHMFYQVENVDLFLWTAQKLSMPKRNPDDGMMVPADLRH